MNHIRIAFPAHGSHFISGVQVNNEDVVLRPCHTKMEFFFHFQKNLASGGFKQCY